MTHILLLVIYLSFISLGLPDGLLGAGWPTMYPQFDVPVSYAGIISMLIAVGTIISSLFSDRILRRFGVGKVTAFSVATTAAAMFGFALSRSFPMLCLWALPYGLGAGSVDASLNNYVALHYASRHTLRLLEAGFCRDLQRCVRQLFCEYLFLCPNRSDFPPPRKPRRYFPFQAPKVLCEQPPMYCRCQIL